MEDRSRTTDFAFVGKMAIAAFAVIGLILVVVRVSQNLVDRSAGHYQVSPRLVTMSEGLPRPTDVRPADSVLPPEHPDRKLLDAIRVKEAWDGLMDPGPDNEYGLYQITPNWGEDALRAAGVVPDSPGWEWPGIAFDTDKVEFLMHYYWLRYLGPDASNFRKARAHNGGPEDGQDLRSWHYAKDVVRIMAMRGE